jgi:hydro-lyases, Fe-S type, tartrate/fumarate subfamily, beta region
LTKVIVMPARIITPPLDPKTIESLRAGDEVLLTGAIYSARDAAHKRLCDLITAKKPLPIDLSGQILYFVGPTPAKPGTVIGSAGPTTSGRMDAYSPILLEKTGLKGMIGKGNRSESVIRTLQENHAIYFAATGGAGALISRCIKKSEIVCYEDLGPEAMYRFEVHEMPLIVAIDCHNNNLYLQGPAAYSRTK